MEPNPTVKLICIGRRYVDKKISMYFLTDHPNDGRKLSGTHGLDSRSYFKIKNTIPGNVYQFECRADNHSTIFPSTVRYIEMWKNSEDREYWASLDRESYLEQEIARMAKKQKNNDAFVEMMAPLKKVYGRLSPFQKNAFMLMIINELRSTREYQSIND